MTLGLILRRFLIFGPLVSLIAYVRYRALISPKAEVELGHDFECGAGTRIGSFTKIKSEGGLRIGRNVDIGTNCFISSIPGGIEIGDDSLISSGCALIAGNYRWDDLSRPFRVQGQKSNGGIRVGRNVWLGVGVVLTDGANIGDGVIVTPNSVVAGKIPANVVVQGDPARIIFRRR